jgi:hypothetical protein
MVSFRCLVDRLLGAPSNGQEHGRPGARVTQRAKRQPTQAQHGAGLEPATSVCLADDLQTAALDDDERISPLVGSGWVLGAGRDHQAPLHVFGPAWTRKPRVIHCVIRRSKRAKVIAHRPMSSGPLGGLNTQRQITTLLEDHER